MDDAEKNRRIGGRIRQAREAKGWSQYDLADELDTKAATVSRWEGGSFPKRIGLPRIAEALGKPVEWFQDMPPVDLQELTARIKALENASKTTSASEKAEVDQLTPQEFELVQLFRTAKPILRESILRYTRGIALGNKDKGSIRRRRGRS